MPSQNKSEIHELAYSIKSIKSEIKAHRLNIEEMDFQSLQNRIALLTLKDKKAELLHQISSFRNNNKENTVQNTHVGPNQFSSQARELKMIVKLKEATQANIEKEKAKIKTARSKISELEKNL